MRLADLGDPPYGNTPHDDYCEECGVDNVILYEYDDMTLCEKCLREVGKGYGP